jgi:type VI secretion system protein ImpH
MGPADGRESTGLSEQLLGEPHCFDFFQAVRLLGRLAGERARPVGLDNPPEQEVVRFRAQPSQSFPAAAVHRITNPQGGAPRSGHSLEMTVAFLGLTGPLGVLPQHYTTLVMRRIRDKDLSLRDWLDVFNHRAVSFFYRAWEKYRLPVAYERARLDPAGEEDLATWCLYCLAGLGTEGLRGRLVIDDEAFLYYAGHFAHFPRSAVALEGMLADYFDLPVRVEQAWGQWLILDDEDRSRLPGAAGAAGLHCELGVSLILGERVWDVQSNFRVRIGPLTCAQFRRFLPTGDGLKALCQMTRAYVGPDLDFDVQPILRAAEVPPCRLGGAEPTPLCLGWDAWLCKDTFESDVADAVFALADV